MSPHDIPPAWVYPWRALCKAYAVGGACIIAGLLWLHWWMPPDSRYRRE